MTRRHSSRGLVFVVPEEIVKVEKRPESRARSRAAPAGRRACRSVRCRRTGPCARGSDRAAAAIPSPTGRDSRVRMPFIRPRRPRRCRDAARRRPPDGPRATDRTARARRAACRGRGVPTRDNAATAVRRTTASPSASALRRHADATGMRQPAQRFDDTAAYDGIVGARAPRSAPASPPAPDEPARPAHRRGSADSRSDSISARTACALAGVLRLAIAPSAVVAARATLTSASAVAVHASASTASTDPWASNASTAAARRCGSADRRASRSSGTTRPDGKRPSARTCRDAPLAVLRGDRRERRERVVGPDSGHRVNGRDRDVHGRVA